MFSFDFVKRMKNFINVYGTFSFPVIICDDNYKYFWSNTAAKNFFPRNNEKLNIKTMLDELDFNEVEKKLKKTGYYTIMDILPFRGLKVNIYPIYHPVSGKIEAKTLVILADTEFPELPIDYISKTGDAFSDNIRSILHNVFSTTETMALKADLLEADWIIPHLNRIGLNHYQILRLSSNITYYAKLQNQQAQMELVQFDVFGWLRSIQYSVESIAENIEVHVAFNIHGESACSPVDSEWFQVAFFNIVHNSMYYTKPGNQITITAMESLEGIKIVIEDRGLGIADEIMKTIFRPYVSSAFGEDIPGVGLGLALASRIIHKHNGVLTVESEEGLGAKVTIQIPVINKFTGSLALEQGAPQRYMHDRFSPLYVGLTSALLSPFAEYDRDAGDPIYKKKK